MVLQIVRQARNRLYAYRDMSHDRREGELYKPWGAYAHVIKIYAQMITGSVICLLLITKAVLYAFGASSCGAHPVIATDLINFFSSQLFPQPQCGFFGSLVQRNALAIVGDGLMYSAGFELAYMLFTPGPDEAIEPVILGMAATILIIISDEKTNWFDAVVPAALTLCIGFLFYLKKVFLPEHEQGPMHHRRPYIGITVLTGTEPRSSNSPPSDAPPPTTLG